MTLHTAWLWLCAHWLALFVVACVVTATVATWYRRQPAEWQRAHSRLGHAIDLAEALLLAVRQALTSGSALATGAPRPPTLSPVGVDRTIASFLAGTGPAPASTPTEPAPPTAGAPPVTVPVAPGGPTP